MSDPVVSKEGWLVKEGGSYKSWKRRWCRLEGTKLRYFESATATEPKGEVDVENRTVGPSDPSKGTFKLDAAFSTYSHVFEIITPGRVYHFCSDTEKLRDSWVVALRKASGRTTDIKSRRGGGVDDDLEKE